MNLSKCHVSAGYGLEDVFFDSIPLPDKKCLPISLTISANYSRRNGTGTCIKNGQRAYAKKALIDVWEK